MLTVIEGSNVTRVDYMNIISYLPCQVGMAADLLRCALLVVLILLQVNSEDLTSGMDSNFKTLNRSYCVNIK